MNLYGEFIYLLCFRYLPGISRLMVLHHLFTIQHLTKMKSPALFFAPLLSAALIFAFTTSTLAQKVATWKGGAPGRPADWYCSSNWEEGRLPNEFSQVIIPDVSTSGSNVPVLASGEVEIWGIFLQSGASLKINKNARLTILEQEEHGLVAWTEVTLKPGMAGFLPVLAGK